MTYSDITFKDKNPIKRWLQQHRLVTAMCLAEKISLPKVVLDFGAGNGELCKHIAIRFSTAKIICYEPTPSLMKEAIENLAHLPQVEFCSDLANIAHTSIDLLFCLEVFEHLPTNETQKALNQINNLLACEGKAIIGVPVEIGFPALYKGIFRMFRRFGQFDAIPKHVLCATFGFPPKERPLSEITPGFYFHYVHTGFDHRNLHTLLCEQFTLQQVTSSPFSFFGLWLNPEAYFVIKKKIVIKKIRLLENNL